MTEETYKKLIEWATGDDTGQSSKAIVRFMMGIQPEHQYYTIPYDRADRGRCIRLLNTIPEWWDRLSEMEKLPSQQVNVFSTSVGMRVEERGWKEQIPIIREEGGRL